MPQRTLRKLLYAFLLLLVPVAWLATKFDPYQIDGDAVAYMDIANLMRAHHWAGVVNAYWHPFYPALLALTQIVLHPTRLNELGAYYLLGYAIFFAEVVALLAFVGALVNLRARMLPADAEDSLLSLDSLRLLALGLLVVASQRELSMGKIRPDALLQALMLAAFAALLGTLAAETTGAALLLAPIAGIFLGLAYLTKSFALAVALLSIATVVVFGMWQQRKSPRWAAGVAVLCFVPFIAIAGPYIAALSHQKHRLDFGDSGSLNLAWFVGQTDKMHLQPSMTNRFGSSTVQLIHPEQQLLTSPGIYSYRAQPYGTYPTWFDCTFFDDHITPHVHLRQLLKRDSRNAVLVLRYLLNHPEAWVLLLLLLLTGASFRGRTSRNAFWMPTVFLGLAMWVIYGIVNIEERYVTLAYLVIVLPVFALLRPAQKDSTGWSRRIATGMIAVFAFLALGESLRIALEIRRHMPDKSHPAWYSPQIYGAAAGLATLGVKPGDEIACMGATACLLDHYWARLAQVRIGTEIYNPDTDHLLEAWEDLPNRQQATDIVRAQGAKVLVAHFNAGEAANQSAAAMGWVQLGKTDFYALPLNIPAPAPQPLAAKPWGITDNEGAP